MRVEPDNEREVLEVSQAMRYPYGKLLSDLKSMSRSLVDELHACESAYAYEITAHQDLGLVQVRPVLDEMPQADRYGTLLCELRDGLVAVEVLGLKEGARVREGASTALVG